MLPRDESNSLLNDAIKMAMLLTEKHGANMPFCMAVTEDGKRVNIAADDTLVSDYEELYKLVHNQVKEAADSGTYRAVAVTRHVTFRASPLVSPGTEAIQITLDHIDDSACTCYLPYSNEQGVITPGELFATEPVEIYFIKESQEITESNSTKQSGFFSRLFKR